MKTFKPTPEAYDLLHRGQIALAEVEHAGVRVDKAYLDTAIEETSRRIRVLEDAMRTDPTYAIWRRRFGERTSLSAPAQLAAVVFGDLGYPSRGKTASGDRDAADESAFEHVDLPFVKQYFQAQKLRKGRDTYLTGIRREMVHHGDGIWKIHASFNLHTVATFRSSCNDPNLQNQPVRNPEMAETIRKSYIPSPGNQIIEIDLGQIEFRMPVCYHHDPVHDAYVRDPDKDIHRDMAAEIFKLGVKQVSKETRHVAKNQFVFPALYGSYYAQMAPAIWEAVDGRKLKLEGTDRTLRDHLASVGLRELGACDPKERPVPGTFEHHLKAIEEDFWGRRFKVYGQWKKDWTEAYYRDGGCMFLTGFPMTGPHKKNDITNYPVQSVAFHVCLWAMTRIVHKLRKYRFRTRVVCEIHDCIVLDADPRERDDVIDLCVQEMTVEVRKHWTWICVPLTAEAECCPVDQSWFYKFGMVEKNGVWVPGKIDSWESKFGPWEKQVVV